MRTIELDAAKWSNAIVFYDDLLSVLEAPHWHGYNVNALIDSIVWGGINCVEPPYTVRVYNLNAASEDAREQFGWFMESLPGQKQEWRRQHGEELQVFFEIAS